MFGTIFAWPAAEWFLFNSFYLIEGGERMKMNYGLKAVAVFLAFVMVTGQSLEVLAATPRTVLKDMEQDLRAAQDLPALLSEIHRSAAEVYRSIENDIDPEEFISEVEFYRKDINHKLRSATVQLAEMDSISIEARNIARRAYGDYLSQVLNVVDSETRRHMERVIDNYVDDPRQTIEALHSGIETLEVNTNTAYVPNPGLAIAVGLAVVVAFFIVGYIIREAFFSEENSEEAVRRTREKNKNRFRYDDKKALFGEDD